MFLRRRLRRLGVVTVFGQLAFNVLNKVIEKRSEQRRQKIIADAAVSSDEPAGCRIIDLVSVNSADCRQTLQSLAPDAVMVVGTRIIEKATLDCVDAPFINYHPGITPMYCGVHGGYWTMVNGDEENLGVTVHLVDEHVDTGDVLYQERVAMPPGNNIATYHDYLAVQALPLVVRAVEDAVNGTLKPRKTDLPSKQWYHPTLWSYLWTGMRRGVW